jgi:hypothetical protein
MFKPYTDKTRQTLTVAFDAFAADFRVFTPPQNSSLDKQCNGAYLHKKTN